jgi:hypothetical protein
MTKLPADTVGTSTTSIIITDPHCAWEWKVRSPIFSHVHIKPTRSSDLLQFALRPRSSSDISALEHGAEHLRETGLGGILSETCVRSQAKVDIGVQ